MEHNKSTVTVYFTNEYSRFRMINGNRQLNEPKIKRIIKEINAGNDMLKYYPIQVQENKDRLDILDGQHRFYICKKLKLPVFYILVKEVKTMPEIAKINSNVGKWNGDDFINCYVQQGNKNYVQLREFLETYKFSLSVALKMLMQGVPGGEGSNPDIMQAFYNGLFKVSHLDVTIQLAEDCKRFSNFPNWRSRGFVIAIYKIKKAALITMDQLVEVYNKNPEMLTEQGNYKGYINTLEQIVNKNKQKRIVIV